MFSGLLVKKGSSRQKYYAKIVLETLSLDVNSRKNRKVMDKLLSRFCLKEGLSLQKARWFLEKVRPVISQFKSSDIVMLNSK